MQCLQAFSRAEWTTIRHPLRLKPLQRESLHMPVAASSCNTVRINLVLISSLRKAHRTLQVSVKGSATGTWILTSKDASKSYDKSLEEWIKHNSKFVFCLIQFHKVEVGNMPRLYLATGAEIGIELKTHWFGYIALSLQEKHEPKRGPNKGKTANIPDQWKMTVDRIDSFLMDRGTHTSSPE